MKLPQPLQDSEAWAVLNMLASWRERARQQRKLQRARGGPVLEQTDEEGIEWRVYAAPPSEPDRADGAMEAGCPRDALAAVLREARRHQRAQNWAWFELVSSLALIVEWQDDQRFYDDYLPDLKAYEKVIQQRTSARTKAIEARRAKGQETRERVANAKDERELKVSDRHLRRLKKTSKS